MRLPRRTELAELSRLALPVVLAQVGLMLMGVVDTLMVGRVSAEALAGVALGNLTFLTLTVPASGTLMVLDPIVAQAVGARDAEGVKLGIQRGLVLALLLTVITSVVLLPMRPLFEAVHQPPELIGVAAAYVRTSIFGVFPFLAFVVLRQSLQALGAMRVLLAAVLAANVANAFLNWVFVYGHLGSSAMGPVGSAWATCASRWLMALMLLGLGRRALRPALARWSVRSLDPAALRRMLQLGVPIGMMQLLEFGAFSAIGMLMGALGTREMAAHQIAINLASLTFMVPLGVGAAAAIRVGHAVGAGDGDGAVESARAALVCGVGFMSAAALVLLVVPGAIARLYTHDAPLLVLAALLIPIAGVFQVFDGVQAVCAGVLRGLGDTRVPFLLNLIGFWAVGLPVSVLLGFHTPLRATGLWWGLVAGLGVVAALLLVRVRHRLRQPLSRTTIEQAAEAESARLVH